MRAFDRPGRSRVIAENGLAATSHPLATSTALGILKEGGNAVDAAIAAAGVLAVVEPHMTGLGGDCFAIIAEPDGTVHGVNGSGRAGAAADAAALRDQGHAKIPFTGGAPITVPGALKAFDMMLARFGTMGFDRLFADAVRYARDGFAVHDRVAGDWAVHAGALAADPGSAKHYLVNGKAPTAGTRVRLPALALTLESIVRDGAEAFYSGAIASDIVKTTQAAGGYLTEDDLAAVQADWVTPISTAYGGHDVLEIPPNGQGIVALMILNIMKELGVGTLSHASAQRYHLEIEAARLAYAVRDVHVADPAHMTVDSPALLSAAHAKALAAKVDRTRRNPDIVLPDIPNSDTVYLSIVDRDQRAVSFIFSIYGPFGSMVTTEKTGIVLQNRGACFTLAEGHPNEMTGGKRPMHTIIPAMAMKDGLPSVAFGVMGGAYQPMGQAHVFSNVVDHGMDPQAALDHPRAFWNDAGEIGIEAAAGDGVLNGMSSRGHKAYSVAPGSPWGGGQMIMIDRRNGFLVGGSDPRKDGCALGW